MFRKSVFESTVNSNPPFGIANTHALGITFPLPPLTPLVSFHYVFEEVRGEGKRIIITVPISPGFISHFSPSLEYRFIRREITLKLSAGHVILFLGDTSLE